MADRVSASITIGGTIDADTFAELAEIIAGERLSIEWDGAPFEPQHRTIDEPLRLYAREVIGGQFEFLETYCVAEGLPFVRRCDSYPCQWSPERMVFRGTGAPESYDADENDHVVVGRPTAERLGSYAAIIAYFEAADFEPPALVVAGDPDPLPPTPDAQRPGKVG